MRARITYSVDLDEVPESIAELIENEAGRLTYCDHLISEIGEHLRSNDLSIELCLAKIDRIRQSLGLLDLRLGECESMLGGYQSAQEPKLSEEFQTPYEIPKESEK